MYGLLLESVRFFIKQKHGHDVWEQLCKQSGLKNVIFGTGESYSDTIIPRLSESCSKHLPCGLPPDTYMEFFGNCFVDFTSSMGYGKVLKVYGRSFRDFLDNIDSLHEHLRFGYPKLMSPSFECKEESSNGLTLHYRSRRFGYKNYVIGQVKAVAQLYFNLQIEVDVLDEADILTSYGVKRCHIIYRVVFNNIGFMPIVKEHKMLSCLSTPVDLVFKISPFSFLVNKDLEIFRASSDLNQYFGENMAGKKLRQVFTLRRPPIELTWDTLVKHGRVIFEFVARQASNISLFTDGTSVDSDDLSARKHEWIEKLKKLEKGHSSVSGSGLSKHKSKSVDLEIKKSSKSRCQSVGRIINNVTAVSIDPVVSTSQNLKLQSRQMSKERSRTFDFAVSKLVANTEDKAISRKKSPRRSSSWRRDSLAKSNDRLADSNRVSALEGEEVSPDNIVRPEPIGKQHSRDLSPSSSVSETKAQGHEARDGSDESIAIRNNWYTTLSLRRPEPIGQEDGKKYAIVCLDATEGIAGSSSSNSTESVAINAPRHATAVKEKRDTHKATLIKVTDKNISRSDNSNSFVKSKGNGSILRKILHKRRITSLDANDANPPKIVSTKAMENDDKGHRGEESVTVNADTSGPGQGNDVTELSSRESTEDNLCSTGLFNSIRRGVGNMRLTCFPTLSVRNVKVGTAARSPEKQRTNFIATDSPPKQHAKQGAVKSTILSEPLVRKFSQKPGIEISELSTTAQSDPIARKKASVTERSSLVESNTEGKRRRVEKWLQRQQCRPLHLRGQTKYISSWNMVLFIGTPLIGTVDDLLSSGLYLSDLSMHDGSRFLTMQGTQRLSEIEFSCDREKLKRELLNETTKKLEEEKRRTEELLYSMMPREIAERMKNGDRELTTCETFDDVTILFGYVNDFTKICNKVEAMKVVQLVSEVFSLFDILSENHKVYKFETIGGGVYMLVSGVPVKINEHAREMALMALAMLEKVQTLINPLTNMPLELQIGIHSGPVVAGVIGQATLQYCLFGNTVNIASRMQTTGNKMKIHLSEATNKELQCSEFITEYRGSVPVKGVGNLNTYWLTGLKTTGKLDKNCNSLQ